MLSTIVITIFCFYVPINFGMKLHQVKPGVEARLL